MQNYPANKKEYLDAVKSNRWREKALITLQE